MPSRFQSGNIQFDLSFRKEGGGREPTPDDPFCLIILADFSGRANRGVCETGAALAARKPILVDVDNFEEVMGRLGVALELPVAGDNGPRVSLEFEELDDLHPDQIFQRLELFQALRKTRKRLHDPATFAEAAAEAQTWAQQIPDPAPSQETPQPAEDQAEGPGESEGDMFQRLLGGTASAPQEPARPQALSGIDAILKGAVGPHMVPDPDPRQDQLIAAVDEAITAQMRSILHHPDFQALEAAWRQIHLLISGLETDDQLKLYLMDLSKAELAADLASTDELQQTAACKLLVERSVGTPGGEPWAVIVGDYSFHKTAQDAEMLSRMGKIAAAAGAPFISAAAPGVVGCESFGKTPDPENWGAQAEAGDAAAWEVLRRLQEASHVGLALPRFLLRLPYGAETDPIDAFDFEELPEGFPHERYLWGNPGVACACLLGQTFAQHGWGFRPGVLDQLGGLPVHAFKKDGESEMKPCAEAWLTDRAAERISGEGLMSLRSVKGSDAVQLFRFQSVADPPAALAGPWE